MKNLGQERVILIIYCALSFLLFFLIFPLLILILWSKNLLNLGLIERFGLSSIECRIREGGTRIWFHGASVGEVKVLSNFIRALMGRRSDIRPFVSTNTYFGLKEAKRLLGDGVPVFYAPFDIYPFVRRQLVKIRPHVVIFVETELWPCWTWAASRMGARIFLINGRISVRSFGRYRRIRALMRSVFKAFTCIYTISESDKKRFIQLGADKNKVIVTGNMKVDGMNYEVQNTDVWKIRAECGLKKDSPVIVAGSVRRGEIPTLINTYKRLLIERPDTQLVIAPRHIENVWRIEKILRNEGIKYHLKSQVPHESMGTAQVVILDTMGELSRIYAVGDVVFLGSSLVPLGGQNPVEPALWEKPIITGSSYEDFSYIFEELFREGSCILVRSERELFQSFLDLLVNPIRAQEIGRKAKLTVERLRGATRRNVELIIQVLEETGTGRIRA
ncbi:MAG: 3-deoxy-D-manno-octulosonic acid transferase [Desulfatiglandales bacterium]